MRYSLRISAVLSILFYSAISTSAQIQTTDSNYTVSLFASGFQLPVGMSFRPAFNDLIVTEEDGAIKRLDLQTGAASVFATFPSDLTPYKGMYTFYGIGSDASGSVFAPPTYDTGPAAQPILHFDPQGNPLARLSLPCPRGLGEAIDSTGNLFVVCQTAGFAGGDFIYEYPAPYNTPPVLYAGGFQVLQTIAFTKAGDLFGADDAGTVYKITPGGMSASSHTAIATGLTEPFTIAIEPSTQDIFVGTRNQTIVRISSTTGALTTFATGFSAISADAIAFDSNGNLYAADQFTGVIWKFAENVAASMPTITPARGGNTGAVTVRITGQGLESGATVTLSGSGSSIVGTNTTLLSPGISDPHSTSRMPHQVHATLW